MEFAVYTDSRLLHPLVTSIVW